jgi:hypothetical protein
MDLTRTQARNSGMDAGTVAGVAIPLRSPTYPRPALWPTGDIAKIFRQPPTGSRQEKPLSFSTYLAGEDVLPRPPS